MIACMSHDFASCVGIKEEAFATVSFRGRIDRKAMPKGIASTRYDFVVIIERSIRSRYRIDAHDT